MQGHGHGHGHIVPVSIYSALFLFSPYIWISLLKIIIYLNIQLSKWQIYCLFSLKEEEEEEEGEGEEEEDI